MLDCDARDVRGCCRCECGGGGLIREFDLHELPPRAEHERVVCASDDAEMHEMVGVEEVVHEPAEEANGERRRRMQHDDTVRRRHERGHRAAMRGGAHDSLLVDRPARGLRELDRLLRARTIALDLGAVQPQLGPERRVEAGSDEAAEGDEQYVSLEHELEWRDSPSTRRPRVRPAGRR